MTAITDNITHEERRVVQYVQLCNGSCAFVKVTRDREGREYEFSASYGTSDFTSPREDE